MSSPFQDPLFLRRTLENYVQELTRLGTAFAVPAPGRSPQGQAAPDAAYEAYRRLFAPSPPAAFAGTAQAGAAWHRWQRAAERLGRLTGFIALDASRRLQAALAQSGPKAPPITSLRELHALWVECGEAAYAEAAHGEEFADAQAEWLAAMVELRAGAP